MLQWQASGLRFIGVRLDRSVCLSTQGQAVQIASGF